MHSLTTLPHTDAQKAIAAIQTESEQRGNVAVIAVADAHAELIALLRPRSRSPFQGSERGTGLPGWG